MSYLNKKDFKSSTLSMLFADTADSPKKAQLSTKYFNKFKSN